MVATAPGIPGIAAWRFVQGLFLPPIFAVIVAYIGDEWPPGEIADATGHLCHGGQRPAASPGA